MLDVERGLLSGRPPVFVQIPTAAAPEGDASLQRWKDLGAAQAQRLGVQQVWLDVRDRAQAEDADLAALVAGAGLIYLSGGSPPYLADTLRGTALWAAVRQAWEDGAALAGCSAGAIALTDHVPDIRHPLNPDRDGLALLPHLRVIPHFDRFVGWMPDLVSRFLARSPDGVTVLGVDEETALVGGPHEWEVQGRQSAWALTTEGRVEHPAGSILHTPGLAT